MLNNLHLDLVVRILSPVSKGSVIGIEMLKINNKFE